MQTQIADDSPLESVLINNSLDSAQQRIEERAYEQRKSLFEYDEILNIQRKIVYQERWKLLLKTNLARKNNFAFAEQIICDYLNKTYSKNFENDKLIQILETLFGQNLEKISIQKYISTTDLFEYKQYLYQEFWLLYELKLNQYSITGTIKNFKDNERKIVLKHLDNIWKDHLEKTTLLRDAVGWRGYGQKNPLTEYKREVYEFFTERKETLVFCIIYELFRFDAL